MAKPKEETVGMEKADLKRHVRFAREQAIHVAFAVGDDGKAIVQLDKRKPGRALERKLRDDAPDAKNHRWGTAIVSPDDPKMLMFTVNKAGGGLARKLILAMKGTGINKVKVLLDDGTELESHVSEEEEEDEEEEDERAAAPARPGAEAEPTAGAAQPTDNVSAASRAAAAQQSEAQAPAADGPDAAALAKDLTGLVKRMLAAIAKNPQSKSALTELATDAQADLKRGDLLQASAAIDILRTSIEDVEAEPAPTAAAQPAAPAGHGAAHAAGQAGRAAAAGGAKGANGAAPGQQQADTGELARLEKALMDVAKRIVPVVTGLPVIGDVVKTLIADAQAALRSGDTMSVGQMIQQLLAQEQAAKAAKGGAAGSDSKHAVAGKAWSAARKRLHSEIDKLHTAFGDAIDGHEMAGPIGDLFQKRVDGVLDTLDDTLTHTLHAVDKAKDEAERSKLIQQAQATIKRFQSHVASDPAVKMLDQNPFAPISIANTVSTTLDAVSKAIAQQVR